ncbi:MAG: hypothetical protein M1830_004101 [Pleopsidium flavum]|nr:MAG: hypothetical protein M1830_004101 [Pleopsidium flavum]
MAAVAAFKVGMSFSEQHGLHPFFDKNKRLANSIVIPTQASSSAGLPILDDDAHSSTKAHPGAQKHSHMKTRDGTERSNHSENPSPLQLSSNGQHVDGQTPKNVHTPRTDKGNVLDATPQDQSLQLKVKEVASLDVDPNSARNKRRRISASGKDSSGSEPQLAPWLVQLQVAAYGDPAQSTSSRPSVTDGLPPITTPSLTADIAPGVKDPSSMEAEERGATGPLPSNDGTKSKMSPPKESTPKKRMLKLRANGKLSSPTSRSTIGSSTRESRAPRKLTTPESHKVVIIKYGLSDESRHVLGQKIHSITTAAGERHGLKKDDTVERPQLAKAASSEPAKPTHPFFLGNAKANLVIGSKHSLDSLKTSSSPIGSDTERVRSINAKNSTVSSESNHQAEHFSGFSGSGRNAMSRGAAGASKSPRVLEPAWPCKDIMHIRGLDDVKYTKATSSNYSRRFKTQNRLKGSMVRITKSEDVLSLLAGELLNGEQRDMPNKSPVALEVQRGSRLPQRKVLTGTELQTLVCEEISARLPICQPSNEADSLESKKRFSPQATNNKVQAAVSRLYSEIPGSLTAFDQAQCEQYMWLQKYAPKRAEEVLQPGREAVILRDWLRNLTIEAVDTVASEGQRSRESSVRSKRTARGRGDVPKARSKKRRKRAELLDGFVISSEDGEEEMDDLAEPEAERETVSRGSGCLLRKTVVRAGEAKDASKTSAALSNLSNAVVISGPHGCGKTAAAYAVARELGFEVFELNPGTRRSGKDIMDKVGDMTRNHQVHRTSEEVSEYDVDGLPRVDDHFRSDLATGRQGKLNSFFKSENTSEPKSLAKNRKAKTIAESEQKSKQRAKPKQSLILLEEVDILFEEDKQFWVTVLALMAQSKRPVIMTCNDESLLPLEDMFLHAILRFAPPEENLATDYLLLLAANEGHLLHRSAVLALYESKRLDLRASIAELQFWCQMAVGDKKGGLEWLLDPYPSATDSNNRPQRLRVVSEDTYLKGMGWLNRENPSSGKALPRQTEQQLLIEAWHAWEIDTEDWHKCEYIDIENLQTDLASTGYREGSWSALKRHERCLESISASDLFFSPGLTTGDQALLDPTQPNISEKTRSNFVEGYTLLQSDLIVEHYGLSTSLALTARSLARGSLSALNGAMPRQETEDHIIESILGSKRQRSLSQRLIREELSAAFGPIAAPAKPSLAPSTGLLLSDFDRSTSLIVEDLAPYVRSIISYDLRLERERLRLSNLLSQGGRDGKRIRTTRASLAALEGGSKAHTRRERWLPTGTNATLVLRTGGRDWEDVAAQWNLQAHGDGERRDSIPGPISLDSPSGGGT